ncbi:MAG TPA: DUF1552 domain-containing protein [Gammaproteobacteria bacterium]|nr:DUF1552 domain-containing protein [Gammaproteobacteria bacterium]
MFISKKQLSRRTILRGVGASLALPLLDAMTPAFAQAPARTLRFGTIYIPHGAIMDVWMPKKTGADFELPIILRPLGGLREHFNVVTGLYSEGANAHSACPGFFSACAHAPRGNLVELDTSIDQVIAQKIGQGTTFPSMELAIEDSSNIFGTCAADFLCTYMDTISWRTPTQPLPMELNPRVVFERMFGGDGTSAEARRARLEQTTSILDAIVEDVHGLAGKLGARDRARLDEYLSNVREVERRIVQAEDQRSERRLEAPPTPSGVPESFEEHVNLMFELQALAFQGDLTRVTSFMMGRELSGLSYPQIGISDGHHPISHNNYDAKQMEKKAKVDTYNVSLFAKFLQRLKDTPDGDSNLLENSLFVYGSGMSDGNVHNHLNLPILLAGNAGGRLKGGRHIQAGQLAAERAIPAIPKFDKMVPLANLMVSVLELYGIEAESYGKAMCASNGRVSLA